MSSASEKTITVVATDRKSLDRLLGDAVAELQREATNCGILITRSSVHSFAVSLSATVPFGLTKEFDARSLD